MKELLKKYLNSIWKYDINDSTGKTNIGLNVFDFLLLLIYMFLTVFSLWTGGITTIPYFVTIVLALRSMLRFWKMHKKIKRNGNSIAIAYLIRIGLYFFVTVILSIMYITFEETNSIKVLLTIYYSVFAIFEITDILAECFNASPHVYC